MTIMEPEVKPLDIPDEMRKQIDEIAEARTLTLSDALREAHADGIEQVFGSYIEGENRACAIGAAFLIAKKHGLT